MRVYQVTKNNASIKLNQAKNYDEVHCAQGWPWARARWVIVLGFISKLGLIPNFLKVLMPHLKIRPHPKIFNVFIEMPQYIFIYKN
jgi:hypothetical protein